MYASRVRWSKAPAHSARSDQAARGSSPGQALLRRMGAGGHGSPMVSPAPGTLTIGPAHDAAEHAAERSAGRIGPTGPSVRGGVPFSEGGGGSPDPALDGRAAPPIVHAALAAPGRPLSGTERAFFEPRLGHDFSHVRLLTDGLAATSARAVNARAYTVGEQVVLGEGVADHRVLAHELTHVADTAGGETGGTARRMLRRQQKTIGGPLDLKPDPCVTAPVVGQVCGQSAVSVCEKYPSIPGCGAVCSLFGCKKDDTPKTLCPPNWRVATSSGFRGMCCRGNVDNEQSCCAPDQIALVEDHCCAKGEVVSSDGHCVPGGSVPFGPLPEKQDMLDKFCKDFPNMCAGQQKPPAPDDPIKELGVRWTDEIHFEQDQPGGARGGAVLTPEGNRELESVQSWLRLSSDLDVRLIGTASFEGPPGSAAEYNKALGARRVDYVLKALGPMASRVADPILSDGAESGCTSLGVGRWTCGSLNAPAGTSRPEDRVVRVTFSRNKLNLPQLKLEPPGLPPRRF